jgi:hypothetical protein
MASVAFSPSAGGSTLFLPCLQVVSHIDVMWTSRLFVVSRESNSTKFGREVRQRRQCTDFHLCLQSHQTLGPSDLPNRYSDIALGGSHTVSTVVQAISG